MVFTDSIKPSSETEISEADSVEQYYVTASKLNVRIGSGTNHDIVFKLDKGDKVEIISQTNDWTEIKTPQGKGYVSSKYISTEKPESSETPEWLSYLIIGAIVLYALFLKRKFKFRRFIKPETQLQDRPQDRHHKNLSIFANIVAQK